MTRFELRPWPGDPAPVGVRLDGEVARDGEVLAITWRLTDPQGLVALPPAAPAERRYGLWEATCFECFVRDPEGPGYREINLAPEGHWNAYRLDGYRVGLRNDPAVPALPFTVTRHGGGCEVAARVALGPGPWRLAIAAVLAEADGRCTFWALAHPGAKADFHHPDAFTLAL